MDSFLAKRSQSLVTNQQYVVGDEVLTDWGSDFLWAVFCVMALGALGMGIASMFKPPGERTFYYINVAILTTATVSYFSLANSIGLTPILTEFDYLKGQNVLRQVSYVRYIDWFVTTPLLLAELLLTSGMPTNLILSAIFADVVMVITGLVGALVATSYKWGYYVFGCVAMFYIFWHIISGFKYAARIDKKVTTAYTMLSIWLMGLWLLYPLAWGLCEGGNILSVNGEMVFYGILDLLAKPVFALISIILHLGIDEHWLGLNNEPRMNEIEAERKYRVGEPRREKDSVGLDRHAGYPATTPAVAAAPASHNHTTVPATTTAHHSTGLAAPIDGTSVAR